MNADSTRWGRGPRPRREESTGVMRGYALTSLLLVVALVAGSGCAQRSAAVDATRAAPVRHTSPPPNPDFTPVIERYYQQVEGAHWRFAYAMLSTRYRGRMTQEQFEARYNGFPALSVAARQTSDRTVSAQLIGYDRPGRPHHLEEKITMAWDGEAWTIDAIARREVSPGTR
jgi:hypothetical protein